MVDIGAFGAMRIRNNLLAPSRVNHAVQQLQNLLQRTFVSRREFSSLALSVRLGAALADLMRKLNVSAKDQAGAVLLGVFQSNQLNLTAQFRDASQHRVRQQAGR